MSKTYQTVQGDVWDAIAYRELGSETYTDKLMALNFEHTGYAVLPAGLTLQLPEISPAQTANLNLPPWRRK